VTQQILGLDIGSYSFKVVEILHPREGKPELVAFGSVDTPLNVLQSEAEDDQEKVAKIIKMLLKEAKVRSRKVVTAFPEAKIFTRVIEFPPLKGQDLHNALEWEVERFIPLPKDEVKTSWMVLEDGTVPGTQDGGKGKRMKILLVAAPLTLVDRYITILGMAGLEPLAFESEIIGMARSLSPQGSDCPVTLIISLGASATDLCIVDQGIIQFTRSIGTSGSDLAKVISRELGFEQDQAEEYKRAYGLLEDKLGGKVVSVIKPVFDIIVNEIEKAILSYQAQKPMHPVKRVVLTGGTARLPGVVVYLAESLGVEVQIADPWIDVKVPPQFEEDVHRLENQTHFAVAVGLGLKRI